MRKRQKDQDRVSRARETKGRERDGDRSKEKNHWRVKEGELRRFKSRHHNQ